MIGTGSHKPYRLIDIRTDAIGQSRISLDKILMMAEIVTCVQCGQCVHNPENSRVCAECKATDLEDENRERIESPLAYLDALTAIEISADANAGGCYSPELLDRWRAMGEGSHRQRLVIKALILVGARLALAYQRKTDQNPLELTRAKMFAGPGE